MRRLCGQRSDGAELHARPLPSDEVFAERLHVNEENGRDEEADHLQEEEPAQNPEADGLSASYPVSSEERQEGAEGGEG